MELEIYFKPLEIKEQNFNPNDTRERLRNQISAFTEENNFPDLDKIDIAIIGVEESRNAFNNKGSEKAPDAVREQFYNLFCGNFNPKIVDLGNIKPGNTIKDTYFALSEVIAYLIERKILPVVLGGSQDLTFANYKAYEKLGKVINLVSIDNQFDIGDPDKELDSQSYLGKMIVSAPNFLFNYTNLGYQTYFVDRESINLMSSLYFDAHRLGSLRNHLQEVEPVVRNADMMSVDISAIRQADAPGNENAAPTGFTIEEACQIIRYAGMSDKLTSIGFYEMNPAFDNQHQTALAVATALWYFVEGYYNRKQEDPYKEKDQYKKYFVSLKDNTYDIVFYKSKKSDRWWMEVPCKPENQEKYNRQYLLPCSYNDYEMAMRDEIPDRWLQAYQKLSV